MLSDYQTVVTPWGKRCAKVDRTQTPGIEFVGDHHCASGGDLSGFGGGTFTKAGAFLDRQPVWVPLVGIAGLYLLLRR